MSRIRLVATEILWGTNKLWGAQQYRCTAWYSFPLAFRSWVYVWKRFSRAFSCFTMKAGFLIAWLCVLYPISFIRAFPRCNFALAMGLLLFSENPQALFNWLNAIAVACILATQLLLVAFWPEYYLSAQKYGAWFVSSRIVLVSSELTFLLFRASESIHKSNYDHIQFRWIYCTLCGSVLQYYCQRLTFIYLWRAQPAAPNPGNGWERLG